MKQINYFIFPQEIFVFLVRKRKKNTLSILITKRLLIIELSEQQKLFFNKQIHKQEEHYSDREWSDSIKQPNNF